LSVRRESRGDWQDSESRPGDELGKRDFTATRLLLDWQPADAVKFEANLNGWWDKSDTQAAQFELFSAARSPGYPQATLALSQRPSAPQDPRVADWDANDSFKVDDRFYQASLRGDFDLAEKLTLTSISAYSHYRARERIALLQEEIRAYYRDVLLTSDLVELRNIATVAELIVASASHRQESRGLHYTIDHPHADPVWAHDTVVRRRGDAMVVATGVAAR